MNDVSDLGLERVPSGVAGLDTILGGGFLKGGLYIIQGTPGTGKTTLGNQICFSHVADGNCALFVTLLAEYHARMMQHLGAMTFFDASKIPDEFSYISGFSIMRQDGLPGLLALMRREIVARDASVMVLDGFATAQRIAPSDQALNEFVHELQGIAIATDCTMILLNSAKESEIITPEHTMVDGIVELSERLIGWSAERALQVVKFRGSGYLRGKHAFDITGGGLAVYPRIEALLARPSRPDHSGNEKVSTGFDRLDAMLDGGLPIASTTMVMGPSGVGKTTLGLHFLSRSSASEPGLLFGFYETPPRIMAKAREVCRPLQPLLDSGAVEVLWLPPTDGLLDAYGEQLLEAVRRRGVRRLFIDGLGGFQNAANDPGRMSYYLNTLMNELRVQGVTTVYTLEVPDIIGPHIRTPIGDLSSLAENLVLLRYIELRSRLYRLISILKVRNGSFNPLLHEFVLTDHGLAIKPSSDSAETIMAGFARLPEESATRGGGGLGAAAVRAWRLSMATVLVVDDEFGIAELFDAILADEGHHVLTAVNGRHGLEMLALERVDLVFLDYMMPVMDGAAMLGAMAGDPGLRRIPVVLMSSMLEATVAGRCSGYVRFMRKPFKVAQVVATAKEMLGENAGQGR